MYRFVPLITQRSIVRDEAALAGKRPRWQSIVREAAEQAGRAHVPEVAAAQHLSAALDAPAEAGSLRLMGWENATHPRLRHPGADRGAWHNHRHRPVHRA
ncbi:MAG: RNA methyltransferase [Anaerolineae bacterium]|nr:MAG: RNA methyltransferase [Anaerolineae bacterium]